MPNPTFGKKGAGFSISRRQLLQAGAAAAVVQPLSSLRLSAATTYQRASATSAEGQAALQSYAKAIDIMLKLPPTDPRNWYRQAIIHQSDCPHQNWWFLPWHRSYLWYLESIVRDLSGDSKFALPYWDWTAAPEIPAQLWSGVLTPTDGAYVADWDSFWPQYEAALKAFWDDLTPTQVVWMNKRTYTTFELFRDALQESFYARAEARALTPTNSHLSAAATAQTSLKNITDSVLAPLQFSANAAHNPGLGPVTGAPAFGSYIATNHDEQVGEGPLESQPHDNVHVSVGGFMGDFLSPVDPIFYLHHANVDRLWTVWTEAQVKDKLETTPKDDTWKNERFEFFVDAAGQKLVTEAQDWITTKDYSYTAGSASGYHHPPADKSGSRLVAGSALKNSTIGTAVVGMAASSIATAVVTQPPAAVAAATTLPKTVEITVTTPQVAPRHRQPVLVFVNAPDLAANPTPTNPGFLTSIAFFGVGHGGHNHDVTVRVPLPRHMIKSGLVKAGGNINIQVVAAGETPAIGLAAKAGHEHALSAVPGAAPGSSRLVKATVAF